MTSTNRAWRHPPYSQIERKLSSIVVTITNLHELWNGPAWKMALGVFNWSCCPFGPGMEDVSLFHVLFLIWRVILVLLMEWNSLFGCAIKFVHNIPWPWCTYIHRRSKSLLFRERLLVFKQVIVSQVSLSSITRTYDLRCVRSIRAQMPYTYIVAQLIVSITTAWELWPKPSHSVCWVYHSKTHIIYSMGWWYHSLDAIE